MRSLLLGLPCTLFALGCTQDPDSQAAAWLSTPESVAEFRAQVEAMGPATSQFDLTRIEDRTIDLPGRSVGIRIYDSGGSSPKPALIYVHGACWVAGSLDSHDEVSRYLSLRSETVIIAVDYRLAPEHRYPAAHEDVYEVARWVWDNSAELGIDRTKLAIGGESAGAHFAAATAMRASDGGDGLQFAFLLLVYAALDGGGSSWAECKDQYFESEEDARSRYGSPLWVDDLTGLPPTFNIFGQYETSRAEEELFIRKLRDHGIETHTFMNPGVGHDVQTWASVEGNLTAHEVAVEYMKLGFSTTR
jgi:acetyl esterase